MKHTTFRNALRTCVAAVVLAGLLGVVPAAMAQGTVTVQVVQVDRSRFPEVDVYVSVTDADGQPVKNLMPEDFALYEDGKPASLIHVSRAGEQGPVTTVLVIDRSGSMLYAGKMPAAQDAAVAFVELMRPGDTTGVIAFNTQVTTVHALSDDKESLIQAIREIEAVDDTALYDALHEATGLLEQVSGRKAIIAVTDGMSNSDQHTLDETLILVGEQGISVYTIGLGDPSQGTGAYAGIDEPTLQAIADRSSGIYTYAPNPEDLSSLYELLSLRIQNEYKLTYRSPNPLRDGINRDVVVNVSAASGTTRVSTEYNPGGVIPEVEASSTWGLFVLILAVLVLLLFLPGLVGRLVLVRAGAGRKARSAKGRIRLTDQPPSGENQL